VSTAQLKPKALPPIEAVRASALTPANGESDYPQHKEDGCSNPQEMRRESGSKEDQDEQQRENQYHLNVLSIALSLRTAQKIENCLIRRIDPTHNVSLPIVNDGPPTPRVRRHHDDD
jgi:hypothetical protein